MNQVQSLMKRNRREKHKKDNAVKWPQMMPKITRDCRTLRYNNHFPYKNEGKKNHFYKKEQNEII